MKPSELVRPTAAKAMLGGAVGTGVITAFMYLIAPLVLGVPMDVARMLGGMIGVPMIAGMLIHFVLGIVVFPLLFRSLYGQLAGGGVQRGILWGAALWLLAEIAFVPAAGGGFFHASAGGLAAVLVSLLGHIGYGLSLGLVASVEEPRPHKPQYGRRMASPTR